MQNKNMQDPAEVMKNKTETGHYYVISKYTVKTSYIKGVNRGMQICRSVPFFFAKSFDPPIFLFKSETTI